MVSLLSQVHRSQNSTYHTVVVVNAPAYLRYLGMSFWPLFRWDPIIP